MTATLSLVPVEQLTTGAQLFRCVPYSCNMLARSCVTRQAQADSAFPPAHLLLCKGCELGAEVKRRASDVEVDPHAAARASRKHMPGVPARKARAELPIVGLELAVLPTPPTVPPPAFATKRPQPATKNEEAMGKRTIDLEAMIGKEVAGVTVLRHLPSEGEGTLSQVRFPCGHEDTVLAFVLNHYSKKGQTRSCKVCKGAPKAKAAEPAAPKPAAPPRAKAPSPSPRKGAKPLPAVAAASSPAPTTGERKTYEFPLRRDFTASVVLPENLTSSDVHRMLRFLEALVFEDDTVAAE